MTELIAIEVTIKSSRLSVWAVQTKRWQRRIPILIKRTLIRPEVAHCTRCLNRTHSHSLLFKAIWSFAAPRRPIIIQYYPNTSEQIDIKMIVQQLQTAFNTLGLLIGSLHRIFASYLSGCACVPRPPCTCVNSPPESEEKKVLQILLL